MEWILIGLLIGLIAAATLVKKPKRRSGIYLETKGSHETNPFQDAPKEK